MSTYLQGATDTGFNPIQYTPNFPYMANALQKAQAKYDTNYNEIASNYDKIVNSLSNPQNNEYVNQFLENTKEQIKQLSSKDLSLRQNVDEAERLFAPLWEDEDILADYKITKQYQSQIQEYNKLKNSDKKEDRDRAWDEGLAYVQLTPQELSLAKRGDGSIQKVKVRPFISNINVDDEISKELTARGYDKGIIRTIVANGYINEIKNGPGTKQIYENVLNDIFNSRSDLNNIFKVKGVVQFQKSVFNYLDQNPGVSRQDAERVVKENYATTNIKNYEKIIGNYNLQINGNDEYKGLSKDVTEKENEIVAKLKTGQITTDSKEYKDYVELSDQLNNLKQSIDIYNKKITNLKSDDYYNKGGEDYFTELFKDNFVDGYASTREAAIEQKTTSDATYVASKKIDSQFEMLNEKIKDLEYRQQQRLDQDRILDTDGDGVPDYVIPTGNAQGGGSSTRGSKKLRTSLTQQEQQDAPTVSGVYGKSRDLETSVYNIFQDNLESAKEDIISNASLSLNTQIMTEIPYMNEYVDYLTHYATGGKSKDKFFSESHIKEAYNILKSKNIISGDISNYNKNPTSQLQQLVKYADGLNSNPNPEIIQARVTYDDASKKYLAMSSLREEFDKEFIKKFKLDSQYGKVLKKDKNGKYIPITSEDIKNVNLIKYSTIYGKPNQPIKDKLPDYIANAFVNGQIPTEKWGAFPKAGVLYNYGKKSLNPKGYYLYVDPKTNKQWDLSELVHTYGTPQQIVGKIKNYDQSLANQFQEFIKQKGGDADQYIMNRQLRYSNNSEDKVNDRALNIALDAINENKGLNIIEETSGVIKPSNWDALYEDGGRSGIKDKDAGLVEVLNMIFNNQDVLDKALVGTYISYSGTNKNKASVKLEFSQESLNKMIDYERTKQDSESSADLTKAMKSIIKNGIELDINKATFKNYARDNYMNSVVTDGMLSKGISATDYEKNTLHYDYKLSKGAKGDIILAYSVDEYNPEKKQYVKGETEYTSYPLAFGIDNVLRLLREKTLSNAYTVNSYIKQQQKIEKLSGGNTQLPYAKRNDETDDDYILRLKREGIIKNNK